MVDSYGIELLHPVREGRSLEQLGRKGRSNRRWIVGVKLCVVLNHLGLPVSWCCAEDNIPDQAFHDLIRQWEEQMAILGDQGFHAKSGDPENLTICKRGEQNYRMIVETFFSLFSDVLEGKRMAHRSWDALAAHIAYGLAVLTVLVQWDGYQCDEDGCISLSLAQFCL